MLAGLAIPPTGRLGISRKSARQVWLPARRGGLITMKQLLLFLACAALGAYASWAPAPGISEPEAGPGDSSVSNTSSTGQQATSRGKPVSHWINALRDKDKEVREQAAEALAKLGKPAVPSLVELLQKEE